MLDLWLKRTTSNSAKPCIPIPFIFSVDECNSSCFIVIFLLSISTASPTATAIVPTSSRAFLSCRHRLPVLCIIIITKYVKFRLSVSTSSPANWFGSLGPAIQQITKVQKKKPRHSTSVSASATQHQAWTFFFQHHIIRITHKRT